MANCIQHVKMLADFFKAESHKSFTPSLLEIHVDNYLILNNTIITDIHLYDH